MGRPARPRDGSRAVPPGRRGGVARPGEAPRGPRLRRIHRLPAPALLADQALLLERREHPVEVVLLDAHLLGDLGDRDAGLGPHRVQRLLAARAGTARAPATPVATARRSAGARAARTTGRRRG